jgi:hypothetical protein
MWGKDCLKESVCGRQVKEERVENDRKDYAPLEGIATFGSGQYAKGSGAINVSHPQPTTPTTNFDLKDKKYKKTY